MAKINSNYLNLEGAYLFSEIAKRVAKFQNENPDKEIIKMGIGDVTKPLTNEVILAMHGAVDEMSKAETFRGYGPENGYEFLRNAIVENDFKAKGIDIEADEIFISDGAKSDMGNIGDIFGIDNVVGISDPVYPVYLDTNVMAGREIKLLNGSEETRFLPTPPDFHLDIVYLCSPNNPTGSVFTKDELCAWVNYAKKENAIIFFDAAYESFIREDNIPHSIFEIDGAKEVAIEFRSFSKTAGFTGTRCGFAVVPKVLFGYSDKGEKVSIRDLWNRRHSTKFNGTPYITQKGAAAIYSKQGRAEVDANINYYLENAKIILSTLKEMNITCFGGKNAPYIWLKCPGGLDSWQFFDKLLTEIYVVGTPGVGFGKCGDGYFRLTAFNTKENTIKAMERFKTLKF